MPSSSPSAAEGLWLRMGRKRKRKKSIEEPNEIALSAKASAEQLDYASYISPIQQNLGGNKTVAKPVSAIAYRKKLLSRKSSNKKFAKSSMRSQQSVSRRSIATWDMDENDIEHGRNIEEEIMDLMNEFRDLEKRADEMEHVEVLEEKLGIAKNRVISKERALAVAKRKMEVARKLAEINASKSPVVNRSLWSRSNTSTKPLTRKSNSFKKAFSSMRRKISGRSSSNEGIEDIGLLDQDFWNCFALNVDEAIKMVDMDVKQAQREFECASETFGEAETLLQDRRVIDFRLIDIMDRFYGKEPNFEEDPVALKMLKEAEELSEAGQEAERGRYELLQKHQQIEIALDDQESAIEAAHAAMLTYREIVELLRESKTYNRIDLFTEGSLSRQASLKVRELWVEADKKAAVANRKAKIANFHSPKAPQIRTTEVGRSSIIGRLDIVFDSVPVDMMVRKTVMKAFDRALIAYTDSEKTVRWLVEYSSKVRSDLHECKEIIERWDRLLLKERADIFHRNHPQELEQSPTRSAG